MSEKQSTDVEFDPFGSDAEAPNDAIPGQPDPDSAFDSIDFNALGNDDLDDLFDGADLELEEEDSGEAVEYRDAGAVYNSPLEVGLKDKMWVPIRLSNVTFKEKHTPRLNSKVCLAVKTDGQGKKRVFVIHDQVEDAIRAGATEVIREQELPYFIAEANHVAPEYGQRRYPYEIEVPALTVKTTYFKEQRSGKTGYKNELGHALRQATGATKTGDKVNLQTMPEIASRMEEKIVMARLSINMNPKPKTRPRLDPVSNKPITVLVDTEEGQPITVVAMEQQKNEDGTVAPREYLLNDESGTIWQGDSKLLIPLGDQVFAIRDASENSAALMEEYVKIVDYLDSKSPLLPVPEREVEVEMVDESLGKIKGEITWGTVGAIVQGRTSGDYVDVLLKTGKKVTAVWLGTHWMEVASDAGESGGMSEFAEVSGL